MANPEHLEILKQGVEVWNRWRKEHPEIRPNLNRADLTLTNLASANLFDADLESTNLSQADLSRADLGEADLGGADLTNAQLYKANFKGALLEGTKFIGVDLSEVEGLDDALHFGPSYVDFHTGQFSKGIIPENFLRGTGISDTFIAYITSLTGEAIQYHSCFISYSSQDEEFAQRLYADLQDKGVRCWFAPEDMKIGGAIASVI